MTFVGREVELYLRQGSSAVEGSPVRAKEPHALMTPFASLNQSPAGSSASSPPPPELISHAGVTQLYVSARPERVRLLGCGYHDGTAASFPIEVLGVVGVAG